ncbi:MAG: hypothetical protein QW751_01140 [Candidatus Aenigmatarchaeota archaeon]
MLVASLICVEKYTSAVVFTLFLASAVVSKNALHTKNAIIKAKNAIREIPCNTPPENISKNLLIKYY